MPKYPNIIAVRLTDEQIERYRRLAKSRRRPLSTLIRIVLDEECDIAFTPPPSDMPECPGPDCLMCNGEACNLCDPGPGRPRCEHATDERHRERNP